MGRKATTQDRRHLDRRHLCGGLAHLVPAAAVALLTGVAFALGQTPTSLAYQAEQTGAAPAAAPASEIRRIAIVLARELRDLSPPISPPHSRAGGSERSASSRRCRVAAWATASPISPLDNRPPDDGVAGARLAINDNNTTGRFLGQEFTLTVVQSSNAAELIADTKKQVDAGASFVIADASAPTLLALADALKGRDALVLNAGASDDRLREQDCRPNGVCPFTCMQPNT